MTGDVRQSLLASAALGVALALGLRLVELLLLPLGSWPLELLLLGAFVGAPTLGFALAVGSRRWEALPGVLALGVALVLPGNLLVASAHRFVENHRARLLPEQWEAVRAFAARSGRPPETLREAGLTGASGAFWLGWRPVDVLVHPGTEPGELCLFPRTPPRWSCEACGDDDTVPEWRCRDWWAD